MATSATFDELGAPHPRTARLAGGTVELTYEVHERGAVFLVLHGGGGPATVSGFAALLAERAHARTLVPTHPGFAGTPRPEGLTSVAGLARLYLELLESLELRDVTVIGSSLGGWIAAEMGLADSGRVRELILVDAVGVRVPGHPIADVSKLEPAQLLALSFHRPELQIASAKGQPRPSPNLAALAAYAGPEMADPTLLARLGELDLPVHVIWGQSDRIVHPAYGRALAAAIPGARFTLIAEAGHLPQLEAAEALLAAIRDPGTGP